MAKNKLADQLSFKPIAIGARGLGFDSQAGQTSSPGAKLKNKFQRNIANIMKIRI